MANLMFKMGNHAGLANAPIKAGTVYITKDERCMHVDINDTTRIRIQGSVLVYDTFQHFTDNVQPPFSPEVIYFIASENALVRYDATANDGAGKWIRLNKTAESTEEEIAALLGKITAAEGAITELQAADKALSGRIGTVEDLVGKTANDGLRKAVAENAANIGTNTANIATNAGDIDALEGRMDDVEGDITSHSSRLSEVETLAAGNAGRLTTVEGLVGKTATEGLRKAVADNATNIATNATNITAVDEKADGIRNDLTTAQGNITTNAGHITELQGTVVTHGTDISNLKARMTTAENDIDAAEGRLDGHDTAISGINTTLGQHDTRITSAANKANDNAGKITELQTTVGQNTTAINKNKEDIAGHTTTLTGYGSRIDAVETLVGKDATKGLRKDVADLKAADTALDEKITTNTGAIAELQAVDTALSGRVATVENLVGKDANSGLRKDIATNATNIGTNASNITKNANAISGLDTRLGTVEGKAATNAGDITEIKKDIADLVKEDGSIKERLTAVEGVADKNKSDIAGHATRLTTVEGVASKNKSDIATNAGNIATNTGAIAEIQTNYATKKYVDDAKADLNTSLNEHIRAANAMTFQKTVSAYNQLPTSGVKIGDTYVVSGNDGFVNGGVTYYPGDMIIASGTEDANGVITSGLTWNRVETGYNANLDPSMTVANNVVALAGKTGNDLGSVKFASKNDFLTVETDAAKSTINFNLVWGEF